MARRRHPGRKLTRARANDLNTHRQRVHGVILRYARLLDRHRVAHCVPLESEIRHGFPSLGATGKVIYDSEAQARAAADALHSLDADRQVPYRCLRERDGDQHWHLQSVRHARGAVA